MRHRPPEASTNPRRERSRRPSGLRPTVERLEGRALLAKLTIAQENALPGSPPSVWDVSTAGNPDLEGFATKMSVNVGQTESFKINDKVRDPYHIDIFRVGYYGGMGARKVATISSSRVTERVQPSPLTDAATGLVDCGNWSTTASWPVPSDATSGVYLARINDDKTNLASHIIFIVRDDSSASNVLYQTSDTTWEAYNDWGGNSLYGGTAPAGRAYKVSYNRPFNTRADSAHDFFFNAEYPMIRWLEANGYDLSYTTGSDGDARGNLIKNHKIFMSSGHDEYWSGAQRTAVEQARDAGVNLAFMSGNEVFWKTRWEPSLDSSKTADRTLVCYKETHANKAIDPLDPPTATATWRDPRFAAPADGGRPENALSGTIFMVNDGATTAIAVPSDAAKLRFWRNTDIAGLAPGTSATLPDGTLGYEWDSDLDNGSRPAGLIDLSSTTVTNAPVLQDYGSTYASGTATHSLTLYKAPSGALVFSAGTVQWSWGLDSNHDRSGTPTDARMQQATVNLFADMGVQPVTLQPGLVRATQSTDKTAPKSVITSPASGATVALGSPVTVTGTAADSGGGVVGGVEVSLDGGKTWHKAVGRESWSYTWTPAAAGSVTVKSRAADDSGNIETPSAGVTFTVGSSVATTYTIFSPSTVPTLLTDADPNAVELGVKFRTDVSGSVTAIRYYKGPSNTGTHVGHLWTSTGTLLASATFTGESGTGWQQVTLTSPVAVSANVTYVASYHTDAGNYSDAEYGLLSAISNGPLHALADGADGPNGVYAYGASAFPANTYHATNYYVDVVFKPNTGAAFARGASGVPAGAAVSATSAEALVAPPPDATPPTGDPALVARRKSKTTAPTEALARS